MPGKGSSAGGKCARCKGQGHKAADCTKPDARMCFVCHEVGHISTNCPTRAAKLRNAALSVNAQGEGAQPKNL